MVIGVVTQTKTSLTMHAHQSGVIPEVGLEALAEPSPNRMDQRNAPVLIATIALPPLLMNQKQKQGTQQAGVAHPSKAAKQGGQQGVKRGMTGLEEVH